MPCGGMQEVVPVQGKAVHGRHCASRQRKRRSVPAEGDEELRMVVVHCHVSERDMQSRRQVDREGRVLVHEGACCKGDDELSVEDGAFDVWVER